MPRQSEDAHEYFRLVFANDILKFLTDHFTLQKRCKEEGICPRGDGQLVRKDSHNWVCPTCGFKYYQIPAASESD